MYENVCEMKMKWKCFSQLALAQYEEKVKLLFSDTSRMTAMGFWQIGPVLHLSNHVFRSDGFRKYYSYEAHLMNEHFKKLMKTQQDGFCF